jgi:hypothetical protein
MGRPQQPELARSAKTDLDPDHVETGLQGQKAPVTGGETGPVPAENQPGHHPPQEQDKPDLDAFAARLGTDASAPAATSARKAPRPATPAKPTPAKTTPAKATPAKTTPKKAAPAKKSPASRPATVTKNAPAAPPKIETTPAKRPAAAPAPSPEAAAQFSAPQPGLADEHREPRLVGLVLLPLREAAKRLEQLDRTLTERLNRKRRSFRGPGRS